MIWFLVASLVGCTPEPEASAPPTSPLDATDDTVAWVAQRLVDEVPCEGRFGWMCRLGGLPGAPVQLPASRLTWAGVRFGVRTSRTPTDGFLETWDLAYLDLSEDALDETVVVPTMQENVTAIQRVRGNAANAVAALGEDVVMPLGLWQDIQDDTELRRAVVRRGDDVGFVADDDAPARLMMLPGSGIEPVLWVTVQPYGGGALVGVYAEVPWVAFEADAL